jgi:hypothetical protein
VVIMVGGRPESGKGLVRLDRKVSSTTKAFLLLQLIQRQFSGLGHSGHEKDDLEVSKWQSINSASMAPDSRFAAAFN